MTFYRMFKREEQNFKEIETVIGPSVKVEGDFAAAGNVVIEGAVSGKLKTDQFLKVGEQAKITADVSAHSAYIAGEVHGNMVVADALELTGTAKIYGDIKCKTLSTAPGAIISGHAAVGSDHHPKTERMSIPDKAEKIERPIRERGLKHKEWKLDEALVKAKE